MSIPVRQSVARKWGREGRRGASRNYATVQSGTGPNRVVFWSGSGFDPAKRAAGINWTGAMHGCLAFESFRTAAPGSPIYRNGMTHWSLQHLTNHVRSDTLPQVCWVLPSRLQSEHPGAPSSPARGGDFTHQASWGQTRSDPN